MTTKAKLGAGDVQITLGDQTRTLRPTLRAARAISQQFGGFRQAFESVAKFDLDVFIGVITVGLGVSGSDAKEIPDLVWEAGMPDLTEPVSRYLSILANGGRPVDEDGGSGDADPQKD